ncbi:stage II sporulation protein P [Pelotomaculum propionicicum]|uniref:Stage II sporulation protein P n=1 Tax=Pelotomaculum propionicicum TaxID=258475 RepID=A0A4Y7RSH1_9FIRM|nr:stage II sporulation protein P [Pelotomaculum propionicicum]TEB11801.1 hypothetical protein Pmgp_01379 [Pelotomaculum propionicicum]
MSSKRLKPFLYGCLLLAGVSLIYYGAARNSNVYPAITIAGFFNKESPDHLSGRYTTIFDEQGNTLSIMARTTYVGDELYTSEGNSYRVYKVDGDRAEARFLGVDPQIVAYSELYARQEVPVSTNLAEQKKGNIAIYHSHTDESYVPSDGSEAIPFKGGIYQVGKAMVDRLQGKNMTVNYDQTAHDPHDNNAYVRSRRTASNLMKTNPAAIFDVHRDGVPDPSYYRSNIEGKNVAKVRLVVGRENPKMDANMDFAKRMMAAANEMHAKVVKEIFVGKGDYNQDLSSTALLIEAGTHTNSKEEAERGVSLFTDAVPTVLGISGAPAGAAPTAAKPVKTTGGGGWKAVGWILGITLVLGLGYLLITSGSTANMKKNMSNFGREVTGLFSLRGAARKPGTRERGGQDSDDQE